MNSKELTRQALALKPVGRPPFIPLVFTLAAKLEQVSVRRMLSDATILTRALQNTQKLYGYDAVVAIFDPVLEAEACGCNITWSREESLPSVTNHPLSGGGIEHEISMSTLENRGRIPIVLETMRRLNILIGKTVAIGGSITGPLLLAAHLRGTDIVAELEADVKEAEIVLDFASKVAMTLCRLYCEAKVDFIVLADELLTKAKPGLLSHISRHLRPIWNIARFYSAYSIILTRNCTTVPQAQAILALGADSVVLGSSDSLDFDVAMIGGQKVCIGIPIPLRAFCATDAELKAEVTDCLHRAYHGNYFLTTEWEVPPDTPAEKIRQVMYAIETA